VAIFYKRKKRRNPLKKYFIITYGCQMNEADSERIAASLEKKGYKLASEIESADLIVVNMCSIRQTAVDRIWGKTKELAKLKIKKPKIKTVLTGCIVKSDKNKFTKCFDEIWQNKDYLETFPKCREKTVGFVPISNGCNNFCTYCVVPYARGSLTCRNSKKIINETKLLIKNGAKEIWLLGQNVNDYICPKNPKIKFPELLKIVGDLPGDFQIRLMSPNPKNFTDKLIEIMASSKKIARFLNLPVQSGDNEILKRMNRPYTIEQYKNLVRKIKEKIPDINLTTDVIVGFPGETKKQFQNTIKLFKEIKFNLVYVSKYSKRSGTAAFLKKDNVSLEEKKRRWQILNKLVNEKEKQ